jgi:hypothetical protein
MTVIIIFVVAFIGLAIAARVGLSNATRERRSMSGHRQTLDMISKVADAPTADRDVRSFKVEPLRPVRLDLSKLDDLTDPDLIRITAPLASDDDRPQATPDPRGVDNRENGDQRLESELTAPTTRDTSEVSDGSSSVSEHASVVDSGLVFGEEGILAKKADTNADSTIQLTPLSGAHASSMTEAMPMVEASLAEGEPSPEVGPSPELDGQGTREHRVYSSGRSLPLSAMAVGAGAIAVILGVGFFLLGRNSSTTVIPPSSSTRATTPSSSRSSRSSSGSKSTSTSKKKTSTTSGGSSSTRATTPSKSTTSGGGSQSTGGSSSTPSKYTPVSANSSYATYDIPGGARTIVVSASQPCWVADSDSANGPLIWDQTLPAGGSYTISSTASSLWIKVGNAHDFQMQVNGVPVSFSSPPGVFSFNLVASSGQSPA